MGCQKGHRGLQLTVSSQLAFCCQWHLPFINLSTSRILWLTEAPQKVTNQYYCPVADGSADHHPRVQVNVCATCNQTLLRRPWYITFTKTWGHSVLDLWPSTTKIGLIHLWVQVNICSSRSAIHTRLTHSATSATVHNVYTIILSIHLMIQIEKKEHRTNDS